jgi:hypothetical protein
MADTMRSLATLSTTLADNSAGDISAQDLRDALLQTIQPGYAQMHVSASSATTLADTSTWVEVAGTYTLADNSGSWSMATNGQLAYGGAASREVHIMAALSVTSVGNNQQTQWGIGVDGTILTPSIIQRYVTTGADVGALALVAHTDLAPGSYVSLLCRNITSAQNLQAVFADIIVMDFAA